MHQKEVRVQVFSTKIKLRFHSTYNNGSVQHHYLQFLQLHAFRHKENNWRTHVCTSSQTSCNLNRTTTREHNWAIRLMQKSPGFECGSTLKCSIENHQPTGFATKRIQSSRHNWSWYFQSDQSRSSPIQICLKWCSPTGMPKFSIFNAIQQLQLFLISD